MSEKTVQELEIEMKASALDAVLGLAWLGFLFAFAVADLCFDAYVFTRLWTWHVVPVFGATPLTHGHAAGIVIAVALLSHQLPSDTTDRPRREIAKRMAYSMIRAVGLLFFGWLAWVVL